MVVNRRMALGVLFVVLMVFVLILFYAVMIHPTEYVTNTLDDTYRDLATSSGFDDADTVHNGLVFMVWSLVGSVVFGFICLVLYLFALAHRDEYDQSMERYY